MGLRKKREEVLLVADASTQTETVLATEPAPVILDSGERREFGTGAVRDMKRGNGRCDLMPLDVIEAVFNLMEEPEEGEEEAPVFTILYWLEQFKIKGDASTLDILLQEYLGNFVSAKDTLLDLSLHFEQGAEKYGENNWQKGIPCSSFVDSAVRHYLKMRAGMTDEPHERAFLWNVMCCAWTARNHSQLNEYAIPPVYYLPRTYSEANKNEAEEAE